MLVFQFFNFKIWGLIGDQTPQLHHCCGSLHLDWPRRPQHRKDKGEGRLTSALTVRSQTVGEVIDRALGRAPVESGETVLALGQHWWHCPPPVEVGFDSHLQICFLDRTERICSIHEWMWISGPIHICRFRVV